ncbi:hypothetical protein Acsp06_62500 [Actinomycetospora sp. NBRC 106375]|nr:hypothetical protein Acsp06_62500 [Actinomycetospora sp. NBRC 106375]
MHSSTHPGPGWFLGILGAVYCLRLRDDDDRSSLTQAGAEFLGRSRVRDQEPNPRFDAVRQRRRVGQTIATTWP